MWIPPEPTRGAKAPNAATGAFRCVPMCYDSLSSPSAAVTLLNLIQPNYGRRGRSLAHARALVAPPFLVSSILRFSEDWRIGGYLGIASDKGISFESAFVVNSTNPMVPFERSLVAVAHTHTPHRTARPPAAPPRRERDEEMGQQRRRHKHVWEDSVVRHAARRFLST